MNYADKYVENMVNVGYHSLNRDEMKSAFEKYFNEYLDTETIVKLSGIILRYGRIRL